MQIIYRAFDGKEFCDRFDCEDYEWKLEHQCGIDSLIFRDVNGNSLQDKYSEKTYDTVMTIEIKSEEALETLHDLADYCGFCCYGDINEPGTWKWRDHSFVREE